jgi:hypothetical protein
MQPRQLRQQLQQKTMDFLRDLCTPDWVLIVTDPATGQPVVDGHQVCKPWGLAPEQKMSKLMTDPVLSTGIVIVDRQV